MKPRDYTIVSVILLFFIFLNNLPAETPARHADLPWALKECTEPEQKALVLESQGRFIQAADHLEKALHIVLKSYPKEKSVLTRGILLGVSEAYLHKLVELYGNDFRYGQLLGLLDELAAYKVSPGFNAWITWYQARNYLRTGNINRAREKYSNLGFINQWQIIGGFDNESSTGFNTTYPPENEINLKASYKGKKRQVTWRRFQVPSISGGYVDMTALLRPNKNALAYALTYVLSPERQNVTLRFGSDESFKVWVNDVNIHSSEIQRRYSGFDQDIIGVILEQGWNKILIKTTTTKGIWGFRLRITDKDGNPIKGLKGTADPKIINQIDNSQIQSRAKIPVPEPSGLDFLNQALKEQPNQPRYYFYTGLIHQARADSDIREFAERTAFQKAVQSNPISPYYHYYLARALREEIALTAEKEENSYRAELEETLRLSPQHSLAARALAEYYLDSFPLKQKSYKFLQQALRTNPDSPGTRYLETRWFKAQDFDIEVYLRLQQLATQYPDYLPIQIDYAQQLLNQYRYDQAFQCYGHILRHIDYTDHTARRNLIDILIRQGKIKSALQLYDVITLLNPYATFSYVKRARVLEGHRDFDRALKEITRALQVCPEDYHLLSLKGQYLHHSGRTDEAIAVWQKALTINPNYFWLQRYLDLVQKKQGSFEKPYQIKLSALLNEIKSQPEPETVPQFAIHYLLDQVVVKVNKDGTQRRYIHQIVKILNEKGVKAFDTHDINYNPNRQRVRILTARVIHPDQRSEEARIDASHIDLPPLVPGDLVQLEYRIDDIALGFFGDYFGDSFLFSTRNPTYKSSYTLIAPADKPLYFNQRNFDLKPDIERSDTTVTYHWSLENLPGFQPESMMPPLNEILPILEVSSYQDWTEFGRWYWHLIKRQYDFNDEMRLKLKQLIYPNMTVTEKIKAVYNFVIGEIRYEAWSYGIHGWKPYKASTIFARRFGDCKDKALLINVFLNELGIKSYPVLINADEKQGQKDLTLPMLEHFNHCLSYATTETGQTYWLDGTAAHTGINAVPGVLAGTTAFVIDETGGKIRQLPDSKPRDNAKLEQNTVRIDTQGNAIYHTSLIITGERAGTLRYLLGNPAKRELYLERVFGRKFGGARVLSSKFSILADLDVPVHYQLTVSLPDFLQPRGREYAFRPVAFPLRLSRLTAQAERHFDLLLSSAEYPNHNELSIDFILPPKARVKSLPDNLKLSSSFGEYTSIFKHDKNKISLTEEFSIKTRRIYKESYQEFRDFCNRIIFQQRQEIVFSFEETDKKEGK